MAGTQQKWGGVNVKKKYDRYIKRGFSKRDALVATAWHTTGWKWLLNWHVNNLIEWHKRTRKDRADAYAAEIQKDLDYGRE